MPKLLTPVKLMSYMVLTTLALAGCGTTTSNTNNTSNSASSSSSTSNKVVNITFWNGHPSGALQKQMHAEVAEFNQSHPNIHVSYVDKYSEVQPVTAAFAANDAPNVAMPHLDEAQQFAKSGYLLDLTPFMQSSTNGLSQADIQKDFYPTVWQSESIVSGKHYLLPYEENSQLVIYYNKQLLAKVGVTQPPKTWSDIQTDAKKITALGSQYHGIAWTPAITQLFILTKDFGGKVYADSSRSRFDLNNAGATQALSMLRNMVKDNSMILTQKYGYQVDFGAGKVGILMDASAGYTYDNKSAGGKFTMLATPAPKGSNSTPYNFVDGDSLCIFNTGTKAQQQASWTFIKWLASPSTNTAWNEKTNYVPTGPTSDTMMKSFYASNPSFAASYSDPTGWLTIPSNATGYGAATTAMMSDFDKALRGQESVATALKNMTTVGNEYMSGQKKG